MRLFLVIKKKDVLEDLLTMEGWKYYNVYPKERKETKLDMALSLIKRDIEVLKIAMKERPTLMIGTSVEITHIGKILRIPSIMVEEDDVDQIPLWAKISYPFATSILSPYCCRAGKWQKKTINYEGYHELAYLHPNYFTPKIENINSLIPEKKPYFILRFAKLTAHHDKGKKGITNSVASQIIKKLNNKGEVFITSERVLAPEFEKYRIKIHPSLIHDALAFANLYIGDSQTMATEAAVLGTPSIRFNDFVGKLSTLEELEHKYKLTYGIETSHPEKLLQKIDELLEIPNLKEEWQKRREIMLNDKIDVTKFIVNFIENFLKISSKVNNNISYQYHN